MFAHAAPRETGLQCVRPYKDHSNHTAEMIMSTDVWLPDCTEWIIKLNLGRDTPELEAVEILGESRRTDKNGRQAVELPNVTKPLVNLHCKSLSDSQRSHWAPGGYVGMHGLKSLHASVYCVSHTVDLSVCLTHSPHAPMPLNHTFKHMKDLLVLQSYQITNNVCNMCVLPSLLGPDAVHQPSSF